MSKAVWNYFDPLSMVVIVLTLVLFVIALFVKGFGHELLQECGVFLVSVKLIMMSRPDWRKKDWRRTRICSKPQESRAPEARRSCPDFHSYPLIDSAQRDVTLFSLPHFEEQIAWPRKLKSVTR